VVLGFAAVNVTFEITGHFAGGAYGHYASGISVIDWLATMWIRKPAYSLAIGSMSLRPRVHGCAAG